MMDASVTTRCADAEVLFKQFRIPMPHVMDIQDDLEILRQVGRRTLGQPQKISVIMGPSHCGKTTIIKDWRENIARTEDLDGRVHPVLYVELSEKATVKSMGRDILTALGMDAPPEEVLEEQLRTKRRRNGPIASFRDGAPAVMHIVVRALRNARIEVLVLDELHHLVQSDNADRTMWSVTESIKWLSNRGVCPIVCVGISKIQSIVDATNNSQFANRQTAPTYLLPLDLADPDAAMTFGGYVEALDQLIVAEGILPERSGLSDAKTVACLYDVSKGVLGRVARLVEEATKGAIRKGHRSLHPEDLSRATDLYAIALALTDQNPWKRGPRHIDVIRALAKKV